MMATLVSSLLVLLAGLLAVPVAVFFVEIVAARTVRTPQADARIIEKGLRLAVLVPAHNESEGLKATLEDIMAQVRDGDRVVVVADNCTDNTAAIARAAGAEVSERNDLQKRGKGHALDWGLNYLKHDPPDVVIFIDADCRLESKALNELAAACRQTGRPLQALYLMTAPADSAIDYRVAQFAWRIKNWMRPLGLSSLDLPCQLAGTGMAFLWRTIGSMDLANEQIVEDLKLGLDLARTGNAPRFWPAAVVYSHFAMSTKGAQNQRHRWESGHIHLILIQAPRLLYESIVGRDLELLALTLDLIVPPLTLLGMLLAAEFALTVSWRLLGGSSNAVIISFACLLGYTAAVAVAWFRCGRDILPMRAIWSIPFYIIGKLPLYRQIAFSHGEARWVRTDRSKEGDPAK